MYIEDSDICDTDVCRMNLMTLISIYICFGQSPGKLSLEIKNWTRAMIIKVSQDVISLLSQMFVIS